MNFVFVFVFVFFLFRLENEILKTSPLYREIFHIRGIFKFSENTRLYTFR